MAIEAKRGCGYRKVGGLYLVSGGLGEPCHRLPVSLTVCPTCHGGIKATRGWTWIASALLEPGCLRIGRCDGGTDYHYGWCPVCNTGLRDRHGLLWVGEKYYADSEAFTVEANRLGVSRRISALPRGFELGRTFVMLAHRLALPGKGCTHGDGAATTLVDFPPGKCPHGCADNVPARAGIFRAFRPERVELIVRRSEATPERIAEATAKGITVVLVPDGDPDHDPARAPARSPELPGIVEA